MFLLTTNRLFVFVIPLLNRRISKATDSYIIIGAAWLFAVSFCAVENTQGCIKKFDFTGYFLYEDYEAATVLGSVLVEVLALKKV